MDFLKRLFSCSRDKTTFTNNGVYKLKLAYGDAYKYYIGKSDNIERRIWCHKNDYGSYWTKKYPPISREPLITNDNNSKFWELEETLENMRIHGINNVRGSMFTKMTLTRDDKIKAAQLYCEMYDLCRRCGSDKHYITKCDQDHMESWVEKFGGELDLNSRRCKKCFSDISNKPIHYKFCEGCFSL